MIRFSCHSENFGKKPMAETFSFIRQLDYDCVDVAARSLAPQKAILEDPTGLAGKLRACAQENGLALSELFLSAVEVDGKAMDPACPRTVSCDAFYRQFETICRFAKEAGFQSIMGACGQPQEGISEEESLENAAKTLQKQAVIAGECGIAMHVEPTRSGVICQPEKALHMIELAPDLRYTLDFLHYHVNGVALEQSLPLLRYAGHLHIRQAQVGTGKCRIEDGGIDYDAVVRAMADSGWSGDVCSEFWCDQAMLDAGIRAVEQNIVMRYQFALLLKRYGLTGSF